jgi:hypothetical protein
MRSIVCIRSWLNSRFIVTKTPISRSRNWGLSRSIAVKYFYPYTRFCQNCSAKATVGCIGARGLVFKTRLVSTSNLSPLRWLQVSQAMTTLSQV